MFLNTSAIVWEKKLAKSPKYLRSWNISKTDTQVIFWSKRNRSFDIQIFDQLQNEVQPNWFINWSNIWQTNDLLHFFQTKMWPISFWSVPLYQIFWWFCQFYFSHYINFSKMWIIDYGNIVRLHKDFWPHLYWMIHWSKVVP